MNYYIYRVCNLEKYKNKKKNSKIKKLNLIFVFFYIRNAEILVVLHLVVPNIDPHNFQCSKSSTMAMPGVEQKL